MSTSNTPASVSSVSDASPMSTTGSPDERVITIGITDNLGKPVSVFQYQKSIPGRGHCLTGECQKKKRKNDGIIISSLRDHARQEHNMQVDFKRRSGILCAPLKCPICQQKVNRKQILIQHLRNKNLHKNFKMDESTVKTLVERAMQAIENVTSANQVNCSNYNQENSGLEEVPTSGDFPDLSDYIGEYLPELT